MIQHELAKQVRSIFEVILFCHVEDCSVSLNIASWTFWVFFLLLLNIDLPSIRR